MKYRIVAGLCLLALLTASIRAEGFEVYINNEPFEGATVGPPHSLRLDASALVAATDIGLRIENGRVWFKDKEVTTTVEGGRLMVNAKTVTELSGGRYVVNESLGIVDVYLPCEQDTVTADQARHTYVTIESRDPKLLRGKTWTFDDSASIELQYRYGAERKRWGFTLLVKTDLEELFMIFESPRGQNITKDSRFTGCGSRAVDSRVPVCSLNLSGESGGKTGEFVITDLILGPTRPTVLAVDFMKYDSLEDKKAGRFVRGRVRYNTSQGPALKVE